MSSPSRNSTIRFAAFEVNPQTGELRKHGLRIRLQDQPYKILIALLEKPGEVVSREELRVRIWGNDTFVDFDHGLSAAVNRLRDALGDSADNPRFVETMARRGYRFIGVIEGTPEPAPQSAPSGRPYWKLAGVAAGLLLVVGVGLWLARHRALPPPPHLVRLTTFAGNETQAAFSPDGKQVAFFWNAEKQDNGDVYVKVVGDTAALRLTTDPAFDGYPSWSPDGRQIAFISLRDGGGIYAVSPLGGPERKLAGLKAVGHMAWSADGKSLLVSVFSPARDPSPEAGALYSVAVDGSRLPRRILTPPKGTWYVDPARAPDGRSLAFAACTGTPSAPVCTHQVVQADEEWRFDGEPRPVTPQTLIALGLTWTADGTSLVYSAVVTDNSLWRVNVRDGSKPEPIELAGTGAYSPAIDTSNGRLAFARSISQPDIWKIELGRAPEPFLASSVRDVSPQFSPNGRQIAFESGRGGDQIAVWTASSDGTGLRQVTRMTSPHTGSPLWSPDGRRLVFDALGEGGGWDVWVIDEAGGSPRQLTKGPAENSMPSWSHDGNFIYFHSNRSGRSEIWRVPAQGGSAEQVTRNGGYKPLVSTDGKTLYYTLSGAGTEGLYAKALPGGEEGQLLSEDVAARAFAVFSDGIYYLHRVAGPKVEIRVYEFATRQSRKVAEIDGPIHLGLTVSADRKTFLFSKLINVGSDLMMIENFR